MTDSVRVRVPATSANLGPGFDTLGVALRLANTVTVRRSASPATADEMIQAAANQFFAAAGSDPFPFSWTIRGSVPRSRGLGSSVTVRLGILHGLNELAGQPLDPEALYRICADLEGHPDNAAPAAVGGFTVARPDGSFQRFRVSPRLQFVLLIPDFEVRTADARRVLPESIPFKDAVRSIANATSIAAAFASANYEALRGCFEDFLHEPFRAPLVPGLREIIAAGTAAGAIGGWLSGSGSTIACATLENPEAVAAAMKSASGFQNAVTVVTTADNRGTTTRP